MINIKRFEFPLKSAAIGLTFYRSWLYFLFNSIEDVCMHTLSHLAFTCLETIYMNNLWPRNISHLHLLYKLTNT